VGISESIEDRFLQKWKFEMQPTELGPRNWAVVDADGKIVHACLPSRIAAWEWIDFNSREDRTDTDQT
jgi:hypothetical protein